MPSVAVTGTPFKDLRGLAHQYRKRAQDLRRPYAVAAVKLRTLIKNGFELGRDPTGKAWRKLKQEYAAYKVTVLGRSATPLTLTGDLQDHITVGARPDHILVGYGKSEPYGAAHQWGVKRRDEGSAGDPWFIPPRPFLPLEGSEDSYRLMRGDGPIKRWIEKTEKLVIEWIETGKV